MSAPAHMLLRRFLLLLAIFALAASADAQDFNLGSNLGFEKLERALKLNPYQKQQFDAAVEATQKAVLAVGLGFLQAKMRLGQELLKDRPDPDALFKAQDELVDFSKPYVSRARDAWTRFYASLDDAQVRIARDFVDEKLRLLEQVGSELAKFLSQQLKK